MGRLLACGMSALPLGYGDWGAIEAGCPLVAEPDPLGPFGFARCVTTAGRRVSHSRPARPTADLQTECESTLTNGIRRVELILLHLALDGGY